MKGSIARRDDVQYFFFVLLATLFRGVKPLNRCFAPSSFINDVMSQRAFARTGRSTLVVQDMVAGYEPSVALAMLQKNKSLFYQILLFYSVWLVFIIKFAFKVF